MKSVLMFVFGVLYASGWWAFFVFGKPVEWLIVPLVVIGLAIVIGFAYFLVDNWNDL